MGGRSANRWLMLGVLFLARTAMAIQFQSVAAVSPFLMDGLAIDYAGLGAMIGLYMLAGIVVSLPGGLLGARFGDKRVVLVGLFAMTVGGALMGVSENYALAAAGRLLSGAGAVLFNVLITKMVADWFAGRESVVSMAILVSSWPLGLGLALVLWGPLAAATSWPAAMMATAVLCALALALMAVLYRAPPRVSAVGTLGALWRRFSGRELGLTLLAGLVWTLYNVGYIVLVSFAPAFLLARGYSATQSGAIASAATWTLLLTIPLGGWLAQRTGRADLILALCLLGMVLALAAIPYVDAPLILLIVAGLIYGPPAGIIMSLQVQAVRAQNLALGFGIFYTCYYAGMTGLPALAGLARDLTGDPGAPLLFAAAMVLASLAAFGGFAYVRSRVRSG